MHYFIVNADPKVISIASKSLSLQDILSIAAKEFPSLLFDKLDKLIITPTDNHYIVYLQEKRS